MPRPMPLGGFGLGFALGLLKKTKKMIWATVGASSQQRRIITTVLVGLSRSLY